MSNVLPPSLPLSAKALLESIAKADPAAGKVTDGTVAPQSSDENAATSESNGVAP
jgi:hypothetical protein